MIDDGYRSLDHAIEILRGCVAPYSGEQAQKVAVVLKQWHDKWEAAVDVIYPDERDTIKTLKAEVERMRAAERERDRYRDALIAKHGGEPVALLAELDAARAEVERLRSVLAMRDRALLQFIRRAGNGTKGIGVLLLKDDIGYCAVHWSRGEIERVEDMAALAAKEKP